MSRGALADVNLGYVDCYADVQQFMTWLGERRPVLAFDTETAGLNPWDLDARIRLAQFGDAMTGWTIPWHKWPGLVAEVFAKLRANRERMTIHNVAFDGKYMEVRADFPGFELPWELVDDTMIMSRLAEPHKSAALKRLSDVHIDRSASVGQTMLKTAMDTNKWTWNTIPMDFETYTMYGAMDTVLGARIWEHFQPWLAEDNNREVYELEMQVRRICTNMEIKGFRVDLDYSMTKQRELEEYVEACIAWGRSEYSVEIGSPLQLGRWVLANGGVIDKYTGAGRPSVDKEVLVKLITEPINPPVVRQVAEVALKARKAEKIAGTYFANFARFQRDGIVHPNINTLAAKTSRMSITEPALQTLNKKEATVRDAFIPYREGESILTCDSDQIEARLFANFSRDLGFQAAFGVGDFFVNVARNVYGDPSLVKSDPRRDPIKTYIYSKLYGAGVAKMAISAGVPFAVMQAIDNSMNEEYPGIKTFQNAVTTMAGRQGFVRTPTGRKLIIEDPSKSYVAVNYLLQGHAAECLKIALVNADNSGLGEYMLCPVHDEIVMSVPDPEVEHAARVIKECMTFTDPDLYPVPLTAGPEGPFTRWGDKIRLGR